MLIHNQAVIQKIITNFEGTVRNDTMEGRAYLVAPMIMILEGVHAGSNGPLYYPADELAKTPGIWNHKPIVVYHPQEGHSACDPDILTNRKVGIIMNTTFEDGKLKAEAWLEVDRMNIVDDRISKTIENNEMMEVSTGLFTDNENVPGEWKGKKYDAVARNYRPDHLALLPDLVGACSIADGAGLLRLNEAKDAVVIDITTMSDEDRKYLLADEDGVIGRISNNFKILLSNEISHGNIRSLLNSLLKVHNDELWIEEIWDDFFIYEDDGKLFRQGYVIDSNSVSFVGDKEEVVRVVEFRTISGNFVGNERKDKMEKEKIVDALIKNERTLWTADDKDALMSLNEEVLVKMNPVENEKVEDEKVENQVADTKVDVKVENAEEEKATENMTAEEYIENKVPAAMKDVFRSGLAAHNATKSRMITFITANEKNTFTKKQLEGKDLDELKCLVSLATVNEEEPKNPSRTFNYDGQGETVVNEEEEEPLVASTMDFSSAN